MKAESTPNVGVKRVGGGPEARRPFDQTNAFAQ
jgi:hypothetical protein